MAKPDDNLEDKLPVTAELGDEGGSYGDATNQAETFRGGRGNPRVDPKRAGPSPRSADADAADAQAGDLVKHADEP